MRTQQGMLTPTALATAVFGATLSLTTAMPAGAVPGPRSPATVIMSGRTPNNAATLDGAFTATDFAIDPAGQLVVNGMLTGLLTAAGTVPSSFSQPVTLPVDRQDSSTTCHMVNLAVGPGDIGDLHLNQTEMTITRPQGPGSLLTVPFCDAAQRLRGPDLDPAVLIPLNEIIRLVAGRPAE